MDKKETFYIMRLGTVCMRRSPFSGTSQARPSSCFMESSHAQGSSPSLAFERPFERLESN